MRVKEARLVKDQDLQQHYAELDRYGLQSTEMKQGLTNEMDLVLPLVKRYLEDIQERQAKSSFKYRDIIRKQIRLNGLEPVIEALTEISIDFNKSSEQKAAELSKARKLQARDSRVARQASHRLGFTKPKAMKRSNSFKEELELHGDNNDHTLIGELQAEFRSDKRAKLN